MYVIQFKVTYIYIYLLVFLTTVKQQNRNNSFIHFSKQIIILTSVKWKKIIILN